jgi:diguanylate cyclase (GGDEF)-like protein/PAS domain S-box-containing protein
LNKNDLLKIKQNLKDHILECNEILALLDADLLTKDQKLQINTINNLIMYKKSKTISSMGKERSFIELINSIPSIAIQGYDKNRKVIYWNKSSENIYGYTYKEAIGKTLEELIIPQEMHIPVIEGIKDWFENGKVIPAGELILKRKDQSSIHVFSSHVMLGEETGNPEMFCVDVDLSEVASLKIKNTNLEQKANYDMLTNIHNRNYFDSIIGKKFHQMLTLEQEVSLIMFDVDYFKKINDQYGHDIGDKALIYLVQIVKKFIRKNDILVRWGGEEFILLIEANLSMAKDIANKLKNNIELETFKLKDIPTLTCSFGIVYMGNFKSFDKAYKAVDKKLYLAKKNGRNRVES